MNSQKIKKHIKQKRIVAWSIFLLVLITINSIVIGIRMGVYEDSFGDSFIFLLNKIYLDNFLKQPPLLLGVLVFVGYIALNRTIADSLIGAIKTSIGVILLSIGSGVIIQMAKPVFSNIQKIGGKEIVPLDPYFGMASAGDFLDKAISITNKYSIWISYAFLGGFFINIMLVVFKRWTNVHSIMITGHIMIQQATLITAFLYFLLFRNSPLIDEKVSVGNEIGMVVMSSLILGIYWGVASSSTIKSTNKITDNANFAIGHQQMLGIGLVYFLSNKLGKKIKSDSAENRILPKKFKIFEDNIFTQSSILLILFTILMSIIIIYNPGDKTINLKEKSIFVGELKDWNVLPNAHFSLNIIFGVLKIVAGLLAMITGVRMFVTELQQSFQGLSEKIIPNSIVAVDIAATYGFAPNSVTYGFISGTLGQFLAMFFVIGLSQIKGLPISITIPLFITLFFNSGAMGIYANASGGYKMAIIMPFIIGFVEVLVISLALGLISSLSLENSSMMNKKLTPITQGYNGMADWNLFFGLVLLMGSNYVVAGWIVIWIVLFTLIIFGQIMDTTMQTKKTFLQSLLKISPTLLKTNNKEKGE
ncbi:MAG: PTS ascorbate transporter subunit IIC [Mycoplasma sp.]|nr:PTS ascorbate transporter subunit IIC [Mycoplasma sp.]